MKDPDYVDPAKLAKLRDSGEDAGAEPSRPQVRRTDAPGVRMRRSAGVVITDSRVTTRLGVKVKSDLSKITR